MNLSVGCQVPFKPYIVVTTLRLMVLLTISGVKLLDVTPVTTPFLIGSNRTRCRCRSDRRRRENNTTGCSRAADLAVASRGRRRPASRRRSDAIRNCPTERLALLLVEDRAEGDAAGRRPRGAARGRCQSIRRREMRSRRRCSGCTRSAHRYEYYCRNHARDQEPQRRASRTCVGDEGGELVCRAARTCRCNCPRHARRACKPRLSNGLAVRRFTVPPMLPSSAEASEDLSTSAPEITSEGSTSNARSRASSSVARIRPLSVTMLYCGPKPRTRDLLSLAARGAADGDAGQMLQRVGDVGIRKPAELLGVDGIEHHGGILFDVERLLETGSKAGDDDLLELRTWSPFPPARIRRCACTIGRPRPIPQIAAANGRQIAINVGLRLGTFRLPAPFKRSFIGLSLRKMKASESTNPGIYFRILTFDVIIIFEQVNRRIRSRQWNKGP